MHLFSLREFISLGAILLLGALIALYITPLIRRGALAYNILDTPDQKLKQHRVPVPYLGGIALYLSFLVTLSLIFDFTPHSLGLLLGGTMVAMLGLFDDLRVLPAMFKLTMQLLVVWVVIKSNISIQWIDIPTIVSLPLTVFWLIGVTNSINILDVSDGLATGVGAVASGFFLIIAVINGNFVSAALTAALCGSLLGFLPFNKEPASIYLGDTGSLFIGFVLAALAMIGSYTQVSAWGIVAPIAILFVPIFETTLCSISRLRKGMSPMQGTNDHFSIRLKHQGFSARAIALGASGVSFLSGLIALGIVFSSRSIAQLLSLFLASVFVIALYYFLTHLPSPDSSRK